MNLESISISNFRNIASLAIELHRGVNILYGNNGSGKTNLLEAIFVLCLGRSHRAASETVMVNNDSDFYRLEGQVHTDDRITNLAVAFQRGGRKKVTIDKVPVRLAELYGNFAVVAAGPEDSDILSGSPSARRNFIDIYLSQHSAKYLNALTGYQKAHNQKNAALKRHMDPAPFNELLVQVGTAIMKDRIDYLNTIKKLASDYYSNISGGEMFELQYKPSVSLPEGANSLEEITQAYHNALEEYADKERIMETSLVGTHRDDILFTINSLPARTHGSQGEWRTAAIALKLAVYHLLKDKRGIHPILLLDEIFAELDHKRAEGLIAAFSDFAQLFLTTAVDPPEFLKENSRSYRIADGSIVEAS